MLRNITKALTGTAVVLLIGGCSPAREEANKTQTNKATVKETEVTTPETQKVAATYELKVEGMT